MKKLIYIPVAAGVLAFGGIVLANSETPAANPAAKTVTNEVQKLSTPEEMLSFEEISAKALELANGRITDIELDKDDRRAHYEVDVDFEGYEYDFEFDAYTGEVLEHKREKDRNDDVKQSSTAVSPASTKTADSKSVNQAVSNKDLIGSDKAIESALAVVSGTVEGFELETDDGFAYYEIEIKDGRSEHDVDVNAKDGSILKVDSDFDDDDDDDDWD
ncbi:PepSY domain-containing protein [Planococcus beijingensis]|uniref:PepSY domain-containing protein n=1 Tax=Planococcus beijingensis TaxID=2782551 RepID=UPI00193B276F|nr:PepSY domain-containing protein [Planococcus beijingensis]